MEHTYIKPNARYPAQYWAGVITAEGGHTTSNICESFHTHLGRLFGVGNYNPNIYLFVENLNIYHRQAQIKYFTETAVCRPEHRNTHLLNDLQGGKMGVIDFLKAITESRKTKTTSENPAPQQRYQLRPRT